MKVFKFGGVSIQDALAIRNVVHILNLFSGDHLFVVVSAMGKVTNALEQIFEDCFSGINDTTRFNTLKNYHLDIVYNLMADNQEAIFSIENLFEKLWQTIQTCDFEKGFDAAYDRIVSFGELISSQIIWEYLKYCQKNTLLINAFDWVKTDNYFRFAKVNIESSSQQLQQIIKQHKDTQIFITQGFIGVTQDGSPTTLGREGSDYTAALAGAILQAESVTVWKDVPGLLNADPKRMKESYKIDKLSYREAIELAYYGAKVIHPKTIKPIENQSIPLYIKSFLQPEAPGTLIHHLRNHETENPFFIFHENQMLITISVKDLSFITEESLSHIFKILSQCRIQVRLMQNSAISFSICIDHDIVRCTQLLEELNKDYEVRYNTDLELITIRNYQISDFENILYNKKILLEQRNRTTAQFVVRNL